MKEDVNDISKKLAILEEIAALISRSHELQDTLDQVCQLVTAQMKCDVCSIYLLDESGHNLVLRATKGLDPQAVGKVMMAVGEGITGLAVQELRPIAVSNAPEHPRYKYFPETKEEKYISLMASPIVEKGRALGVINVQTRDPREFSDDDVRVVATIATQVAVMVQNYRLLQAVTQHQIPLRAPSEATEKPAGEDGDGSHRAESVARGIAASPGISMGRALVVEQHELATLFEVQEFAADPAAEADNFELALTGVRNEVKAAELRIAERLSDEEAKIFSTHLMILEDEGFLGKVREHIAAGRSALFAVRDVVGYYVRLFEEVADPYIKDKISDIEDVGKRIMNALARENTRFPGARGDKEILVALRVTPSDALEMEGRGMVGMVAAEGGADSHASILARSFGIPAVVGLESQLRLIKDGDFLIIDGSMGNVYVNPKKEIVQEFKRARKDYQDLQQTLAEASRKRSVTRDGQNIHLMANISIVADVKTAMDNNAEGIGLYRTEFLYITRPTFPTEEEQFKVYSRIVKQLKGRPIVIRTLDAGGDKYMPQFEKSADVSSYLGWRSIRVSLDLVHIFKTQLRAILRASALGKVSLLFPMITNLAELKRARQILDEVKAEMEAERIAYDSRMQVGMMVEVPSAALTLEHFVPYVDFFSVGSNDLTQYTLAVDRNNQRVAALFDPLHPAVLHLIHETMRVGKKHRKPVTLCGEMGASTEALPVLIGLGFESLSMSPSSLLRARYMVRNLDAEKCRRMAKKVLRLPTPEEIHAYLGRELTQMELPSGVQQA